MKKRKKNKWQEYKGLGRNSNFNQCSNYKGWEIISKYYLFKIHIQGIKQEKKHFIKQKNNSWNKLTNNTENNLLEINIYNCELYCFDIKIFWFNFSNKPI